MYLASPVAELESSSTPKARPEMPWNQLNTFQVGYTKAAMSFDYVSVYYSYGTYPRMQRLQPPEPTQAS